MYNKKAFTLKLSLLSEMNDLVDEMVAAVDDGDGVIDYEEFVNMIKKY